MEVLKVSIRVALSKSSTILLIPFDGDSLKVS